VSGLPKDFRFTKKGDFNVMHGSTRIFVIGATLYKDGLVLSIALVVVGMIAIVASINKQKSKCSNTLEIHEIYT